VTTFALERDRVRGDRMGSGVGLKEEGVAMTKNVDSTTITGRRCPLRLIGADDALRACRPAVATVHLDMRVDVEPIPDVSRGVTVT